MKKFALLALLSFFGEQLVAQNYWQQKVDHQIEITLNPLTKQLDGQTLIKYTNNSPDTLSYVWLHTWMNAYKNDRSSFTDDDLYLGSTDFYFAPEEKRGYINKMNFKVDGVNATYVDDSLETDIVKLFLPDFLLPGASIIIQTPFHIKLPYLFSRAGFKNDFFSLCQWYPKPAVYDKDGWHPMTYLNIGEYYNEFGDYDVTINLPSAYKVAATGEQISANSLNDSITQYRFAQRNVTDFAWFAAKNLTEQKETVDIDGKKVDAYIYSTPDAEHKEAMEYLKRSLKFRSNIIGTYPFSTAKIVIAPFDFGGGMEYPTIAVVSNSKYGLDELISHEVGHNWFQATLASNERKYPFMDEGFNSYVDDLYNDHFKNHSLPKNANLKNKLPKDFEKLGLSTIIATKQDQPIAASTNQFTDWGYMMVAYKKTLAWLKILREKMGDEKFELLFKTYYESWKFKHPQPKDFKHLADSISGIDLTSTFDLLNKKGRLEAQKNKSVKLTGFFNLSGEEKHHYIALMPLVGFNKNDKLMVGGALHNITLPPSAFRFVVAPMFALGSQEVNFASKMSYNYYPGRMGQKLTLGLGAMKFTGSVYKDSTEKNNYLTWRKIVPFVRYNFPNKFVRSTVSKFVEVKYFALEEKNVSFQVDTATGIVHISYPMAKNNIVEANFSFNNYRKLYPYKAELQFQHNKSFSRATFTGNYFFNYAKGGGLSTRLFAGKFIYNTNNLLERFYTDRYQLNMTGAKGNEDYTYQNYFVGRGDYESGGSRQIIIRDGGFKMRTDLLSNKIGKSDDWLASLNFTSTIPKRLNPLAALPFEVPVKLFADIGTNAAAWKENATAEKILFEAGFQISLLKDVVNIYFPITYSKPYKEYAKSIYGKKVFAKNISFSIDIDKLKPESLVPKLNW